MVCPARDTETEEALQPGDFSWIEEVKAQDTALLEQSLEEQQGPRAHNLFHSAVETSIEVFVAGIVLIELQPL